MSVLYVYDEENKNKIRLYVLKKSTMYLLKDLIINYNQSNDSISNKDYVVKLSNDEYKKLIIYSRDLFLEINDIILKSANRKHGVKDIDEEPVQTILAVDPVSVVVETPITEGQFTYRSKEPTYMRNAYGDLIRVN